VRESTADELGAVLRNLPSCAASASRPRRVDRVGTVPQLRPEWETMAKRYLDHEMLVVGPGSRPGWRCATTTRARSGPDRPRQRRSAAYDKVHGA
jgi:type III pantothenate kinase